VTSSSPDQRAMGTEGTPGKTLLVSIAYLCFPTSSDRQVTGRKESCISPLDSKGNNTLLSSIGGELAVQTTWEASQGNTHLRNIN
jgi:hypothetical protein